MTVLIFGLGRSGRAALALVRRQGHTAVAYDRAPSEEDRRAVTEHGADLTAAPTAVAADVCISAPGVPIDHPDLVALRARGVPVIGEVEWVYRTIPATYLGVTGTAGKGTVTRWLADALAAGGIAADIGGNFEPALAAIAEPGGTYVVEMSSFQLERVDAFRPRVAVVLNLGEDHLDRHGTVTAYHEAKRALLRNLAGDDVLVFNADDPVARAWAESCPARTRGFSVRAAADAYLDDGTLVLDDAPLLPRDRLRVAGEHQVANALAVALAADAMGVPRDDIAEALAAFEGLPGRHVLVAERDGIRYVDDSIATRELAVRAALEAATAPVAWILGGQDKGARPERLEGIAAERVAVMIGMGACGEAYVQALAGAAPHALCRESGGAEAMACAVSTATAYLRQNHGGRGTVLLAPLAASFDQFRDYKDRSEAFRRAVAEEVAWTASS